MEASSCSAKRSSQGGAACGGAAGTPREYRGQGTASNGKTASTSAVGTSGGGVGGTSPALRVSLGARFEIVGPPSETRSQVHRHKPTGLRRWNMVML